MQSERGKRDSSSRVSGLHLLKAEQLGEGDGIVAVRAEPAKTEATAEDVAVGATLLSEEPGLAGWALVDGGRAWRAGWDRNDRSNRLAGAPGRLTAAI